MSRPYKIPAPKIGLLDRVMPQSKSWAWLWRVRYAFLGQTKAIEISTRFIDFSGVSAELLATKPDFAGADGLRVWRLKDADLKRLRQRLKEKSDYILDSGRITLGDKTICQMHSGSAALINGTQQPVGSFVEVLPFLSSGTIDLTAAFSFSEVVTNPTSTSEFPSTTAVSIHTNFDLAGRFQLSKEMNGMFVLPAAPPSTNQKRVGLLFTSTVIQPKK